METNKQERKMRKILYEVKETIWQHEYAARNDKEYPTSSDYEEIRKVIEKLQSLFNQGENLERNASQQTINQGSDADNQK